MQVKIPFDKVLRRFVNEKDKKIKKTTFSCINRICPDCLVMLLPGIAFAQEEPIPFPEVENSSSVVNIILLLTILSIAPAILLMMTCFTGS